MSKVTGATMQNLGKSSFQGGRESVVDDAEEYILGVF